MALLDFKLCTIFPANLCTFFNRFFRAYSPGSVVAAGEAAAGVWAGHPLVAADPAGWIDASRAGAHHGLWPPHHEQPRYVSPGGGSVKWGDMSNAGVGIVGNGGYKKTKAKSEPHGGPGSVTSGSEGAGGGFIPDETLQHLTVKELNKRVRSDFVFVAFQEFLFSIFTPLYFRRFSLRINFFIDRFRTWLVMRS